MAMATNFQQHIQILPKKIDLFDKEILSIRWNLIFLVAFVAFASVFYFYWGGTCGVC